MRPIDMECYGDGVEEKPVSETIDEVIAENVKALVSENKALLARVAELERERDEARTLRDELHLESIRNADFSALLIRERDAAIKERDEAEASNERLSAALTNACDPLNELERKLWAMTKERDEARRERDARASAAVARTDWPEWWLGEVYHEVARNYPGDLTSESFSEYWAAIKRRCADAMEAAEERARESFTRQVIVRASVATSTTLRDAITDAPNPEK